MMRLFRAAIFLLFIAAVLLFGRYLYLDFMSDKTVPVIFIDGDMLEVELDATDEDLLAGVSAYDVKDGDLTNRIIVESVSKFTEKGVCKVYYAVCDNDDHVASAMRKITYKGYVSPKFYMNRSLCFSQLETVDAGAVIGAVDLIDGDISSNIIVTSSDYEYGMLGTYNVNAEVSNSKGDQISIKLSMIVEDRSLNSPVITLSEYLIYVDKG
ncbi:MAG: hypothetical protein K6C36_03965, partial [Clostridia bacterium]|nr:hypothetical protein [Clostridia bacterium]